MNAQTRRAGPGTPPQTGSDTSASENTTRNGHHPVTADVTGTRPDMAIAGVLVLVGRRVAPDQRRRQDLITVLCPCGHEHVHRSPGIRRAPCGAKYVVVAE